MYTVHIFPALAYALNYKCTDLEFRVDHWQFILPISVLYCVINYYETTSRGRPLYWFLTWEDYKSPLICSIISLVIVLVWIGIAKLTVYKSRKTLYSDG